MALIVLLGMLLLILGSFPLDQVYGLEKNDIYNSSKDCDGSDRLVLVKSVDGHAFIVNEKRVYDPLICEVFNRLFDKNCLLGQHEKEIWARIRYKHCAGDFSPDVTLKNVRKLLLQQSTSDSILNQLGGDGQGKEERALKDGSPNVVVALPVMFLLCCAMMCPCFRIKKKDTIEQDVLDKELKQVDSVSEVSLHTERVPGTPLRVPASPLRVPASPSRFSLSPQLNRVGSVHLSINEIIKATHSFSPSVKLGEGGFGAVYKAQLQDGQIVAVKRAKKEYVSSLRDEFSNEVQLLAKIEHRNLVKLLGYTDKGNERIIITEYVPNGTLREHLDGHYGRILDFNQRLEVAIDVAHGLTYLHLYAEKTIIHRDVKSSNILLTENYRAKVSDFGFARLGPAAEQTHIYTKVKGTAGYLDPEYLRTYQLTPKSDVYSFGILLLEIISGRRPVDLKKEPNERVTVRWAFDRFNEGDSRAILDPLLNEEVDLDVLNNILSLAFQCAAPTRKERPTMKEVGEQLWEIRKAYGKRRNNLK